MPIVQNKRLPSDAITADRASVLALRQLTDYAPANPVISMDNINALEVQLREAEEAEILAMQALDAARDARTNAGWKLHNVVLDAKAAVRSQYGADSDAIQAVGLKKRSDYRRRNPKSRNSSDS